MLIGSSSHVSPEILHDRKFVLNLLSGSQLELYHNVVTFVLKSVVCELLAIYLPAQLFYSLFKIQNLFTSYF